MSQMIGIATVVTLGHSNSIHMLTREIPLLTKLQVIIYATAAQEVSLILSRTSLLDIKAKEYRLLIRLINELIHKNQHDFWHRAIGKSFHILCKGLGVQEY